MHGRVTPVTLRERISPAPEQTHQCGCVTPVTPRRSRMGRDYGSAMGTRPSSSRTRRNALRQVALATLLVATACQEQAETSTMERRGRDQPDQRILVEVLRFP